MGVCASQESFQKPRPLIRLVKIKMDKGQKAKEFESMLKIWKKIDSGLQKVRTQATLSVGLVEECDTINKFLQVSKNEKTIKFSNLFFPLYDKFQQKLYEEINQNQQVWIKQQQIFENVESLNEKFSELGYSSKGFTQSLTKY